MKSWLGIVKDVERYNHFVMLLCRERPDAEEDDILLEIDWLPDFDAVRAYEKAHNPGICGPGSFPEKDLYVMGMGVIDGDLVVKYYGDNSYTDDVIASSYPDGWEPGWRRTEE